MKKIYNTDININNLESEVELFGWVAKKRNLGGLIFVDLRDKSGIIQLVFNPDFKDYDLANNLKNEYVIKVCGKVVKRESTNPNLKTGEIEVLVSNLEILNESEEIPFVLTDDTTALEDTFKT